MCWSKLSLLSKVSARYFKSICDRVKSYDFMHAFATACFEFLPLCYLIVWFNFIFKFVLVWCYYKLLHAYCMFFPMTPELSRDWIPRLQSAKWQQVRDADRKWEKRLTGVERHGDQRVMITAGEKISLKVQQTLPVQCKYSSLGEQRSTLLEILFSLAF